jgi:ring-1,2-phenylacetyl-CoA epoxidase subunit PaaC
MNKEEITFQYLLHLGDNSLILGQRNAEWCGHGPVLEQDIALTNISLDLFGESRNIYQYAAQLKGDNHTEDTLAFLRDVLDFKNVLLVEQPNIDWAYTICRQFFFDAFHYLLQHELLNSKDEKIVEIANKTIKESAYHLKWSSEWMIRLGDGTDISHQKIQNAVNDLWEFTGELFIPSDIETAAFELGIGADLRKIKKDWEDKVFSILNEATLSHPQNIYFQTGGKTGIHSEHLGFVLAEMQYLQRSHPGAEW